MGLSSDMRLVSKDFMSPSGPPATCAGESMWVELTRALPALQVGLEPTEGMLLSPGMRATIAASLPLKAYSGAQGKVQRGLCS